MLVTKWVARKLPLRHRRHRPGQAVRWMPNPQTQRTRPDPCRLYPLSSTADPCCWCQCASVSTSVQPSKTLACQYVGLSRYRFCWTQRKTRSISVGTETIFWIPHLLLCNHRCVHSSLSTYSWQPCTLSSERVLRQKELATKQHHACLCQSQPEKDTRFHSRRIQTSTFLVWLYVPQNCAREAFLQAFSKCCPSFSSVLVIL